MNRDIQLNRPNGAITSEEIAAQIKLFKSVSDVKIANQLNLNQKGIDEYQAGESEIVVSYCEFSGVLNVSKFISSITFRSCRFKRKVVFSEISQMIKLEFENCIFEDEVDFENCTISIFAFNNVDSYNRIGAKNIVSKTLLIHSLSTGKGYFILANPKIENFSFIEFEKKAFLSIEVIKAKDVSNSWEYYIKKAHLFLNDENSSNVEISDIILENLLVEGSSKNALLRLQRMKVINVELRKFNCQSEVIVQQIYKSDSSEAGTLILLDSYLSQMRLFDIDFNLFNEVFVTNSIFPQIQYGNIVWCKNIRNTYTDKRESYFQSKEIYRQLKVVMSANHDRFSELEYHKMEVGAYLNGLRLTKGKLAEKFILYTSYISNNHGLSFTWALLWILGLSLVAFNLNKFLLGYNSFNSSLFFEDAANWLLSINPVRKFSDVYKIYNSNWEYGLAVFIDALMRIVYSYLIFQFISAFRKYVRK